MTVDAHRAPRQKPGRTGPRALLASASLFALLTALLVIGVAPAPAQETVIIGGNRGGTRFIGGPGSGVTINNEVLDSLGPAGPAPGLPYMPQAASLPSEAPQQAEAPQEPEVVPATPVEPAAAPPAPPVLPALTQELQATAEPPPAPEPPAKAEVPPPPTAGLEEVRVLFKDDSAELSKTAKRALDAFAKLLIQDTSSRMQLLAFAKAADNASRTRRLSLSRALAVRAYLIDQGVRSTRMDVRALGHNVKGGPVDRVDILPRAARQ